MNNIILEKHIEKSPIPVSIEGIEQILFQMKNSICKIIKCDGEKGTGFFCRIPCNNYNLLPVLISNNHVLNEDDIQNNKKIEFTINDDRKSRSIKIDKNRIKYTNEELDVTIIEIKPKEDKIDNFLDIDFSIEKDLENIYNNKSIYILHYPKGTNANVSFGLTKKLIDSQFIHQCSTERGSSGSPILLLDSFKVIGIHKGTKENFEFNYGIFIKEAINLFNQKDNNNNNINVNNEDKNNIKEKYNNNQQENNNMNDMNQSKNSYGINQINNFENNMMYGMNMCNNMTMTLENYSTLSRLIKEFKLCCQDSFLPEIVNNFRLDEDNIFRWKVDMRGPKNTPYEEGLFTILIIFPKDYPKHGAEFRFVNKIYHLNVDCGEDKECFGHISLTSLNEWITTGKVHGRPLFSVKYALLDIFYLFYKQGFDSPYDGKMAELYCNNKQKFDIEAKKWTKQYASINNYK